MPQIPARGLKPELQPNVPAIRAGQAPWFWWSRVPPGCRLRGCSTANPGFTFALRSRPNRGTTHRRPRRHPLAAPLTGKCRIVHGTTTDEAFGRYVDVSAGLGVSRIPASVGSTLHEPRNSPGRRSGRAGAASREEPDAAISFGRDRSMSEVAGLYFWAKDGSARSGTYVLRSLEDAVADLLADVLADNEGAYFKSRSRSRSWMAMLRSNWKRRSWPGWFPCPEHLGEGTDSRASHSSRLPPNRVPAAPPLRRRSTGTPRQATMPIAQGRLLTPGSVLLPGGVEVVPPTLGYARTS